MPTTITLPDSLADRIGAVASASHRTPLCIIQLCLNAHLPALEEAAKHLAVFHPEKPAGPAVAATSPSTTTLTPDQVFEAVATVTGTTKGRYITATLATHKLYPDWPLRHCMKWLKIPSQNYKYTEAALADSTKLGSYETYANDTVKLLKP